MKSLGITIDLKHNILVSEHINIPLHYKDLESDLYCCTIPPMTKQIIQLPTEETHDKDVLIPRLENGKSFIPEGVCSIKGNKIQCTIVNPTGNEHTITLKKPLPVKFFQEIDSYPNLNFTTYIDEPEKYLDLNLIRTDHLNFEEKIGVENLISKYSSLFHLEGEQLTFTNQVKHKIATTDENPIFTKSYRYPAVHKEEVQHQIRKMLDQNIIRPSYSPWSSPIWIVPKKLRLFWEEKVESRY